MSKAGVSAAPTAGNRNWLFFARFVAQEKDADLLFLHGIDTRCSKSIWRLAMNLNFGFIGKGGNQSGRGLGLTYFEFLNLSLKSQN